MTKRLELISLQKTTNARGRQYNRKMFIFFLHIEHKNKTTRQETWRDLLTSVFP